MWEIDEEPLVCSSREIIGQQIPNLVKSKVCQKKKKLYISTVYFFSANFSKAFSKETHTVNIQCYSIRNVYFCISQQLILFLLPFRFNFQSVLSRRHKSHQYFFLGNFFCDPRRNLKGQILEQILDKIIGTIPIETSEDSRKNRNN